MHNQLCGSQFFGRFNGRRIESVWDFANEYEEFFFSLFLNIEFSNFDIFLSTSRLV